MKGIRHSSRRFGVHPSGVSDHDKFPSRFHLLRAFVPPWCMLRAHSSKAVSGPLCGGLIWRGPSDPLPLPRSSPDTLLSGHREGVSGSGGTGRRRVWLLVARADETLQNTGHTGHDSRTTPRQPANADGCRAHLACQLLASRCESDRGTGEKRPRSRKRSGLRPVRRGRSALAPRRRATLASSRCSRRCSMRSAHDQGGAAVSRRRGMARA
jgi:hypothetical protein